MARLQQSVLKSSIFLRFLLISTHFLVKVVALILLYASKWFISTNGKGVLMPQICYFYGITIYIQYLDHNPPHIHVIYQGFKGQYEISSGRLLAGKMPNKANGLVREWIQLRRKELEQVWNLAKKGEQVFPLSPLE